MILHGGGGNEKGVFTEVLTWLIGEENISNIPNNYNFSKSSNMEELLFQYQKELNPIIQSFEECIEITNDTVREDTKGVYNTFKNWAYHNGLRGSTNISNQKFWREFDRYAESSGYKIGKRKSNTVRFCTGIKVVGEYKVTNGWA